MLSIKNLTKSFYGRSILDDVTYNFPSNSIIALVGTNGAGKTTFLNILCGLEEKDDGIIQKPNQFQLGYLPQDPNPNPKPTIWEEAMTGNSVLFNLKQDLIKVTQAMETDYTPEIFEEFERIDSELRRLNGYSFEDDTKELLFGLGFKEAQLQESPKSLSGGWRMRLELAKLLNQNPDFLILDEPTNHLDLPTIEWLENYLKQVKSTILFVSHDESLLNNLPNYVLHLKDGRLKQYTGNYDSYLEQYEADQMNAVANFKTMQKKIQAANEFVDRFKAKASTASRARSRMKMVAKMEKEAEGIVIDKEDAEINIRIPLGQKSGKDVLKIINGQIGYAEKPLIHKFNLSVVNGQKIAIVGANGLGKSTLIKTIAEKIPLLNGEFKVGHNVKIAYYAQDQLDSLDPKATVLENLQTASTTLSDLAARRILGSFLFRGDDIFKPAGVLSGGEKSRLSLARLMVQDANFLLLDEPTNHLDMLSTEVLTEALSTYEGTVMFISHNRSFINNIATHTLAISTKKEAYLSEGNLESLNPKWIQ